MRGPPRAVGRRHFTICRSTWRTTVSSQEQAEPCPPCIRSACIRRIPQSTGSQRSALCRFLADRTLQLTITHRERFTISRFTGTPLYMKRVKRLKRSPCRETLWRCHETIVK
jgi:hypothetical protein